jgi:AcrR family transcriptional regulator
MAGAAPDLTGYARVRNAALELFAAKGVAATSIREVARGAEVSPGLVQHHFPSKEALRDAVNDHVLSLAADAFADLPTDSADLLDELSRRVVAFLAEQPSAFSYMARSLSDHDPAALRLFDALVEISHAQWSRMAAEGRLHADADLKWAALQIVVLDLGTVLFQEAINRHLPQPFATPEGLERWRVATLGLLRRGLEHPDSHAEHTRPNLERKEKSTR